MLVGHTSSETVLNQNHLDDIAVIAPEALAAGDFESAGVEEDGMNAQTLMPILNIDSILGALSI